MYGAPSWVPRSWTAVMFGWLRPPAVWASCSKRRRRSGSPEYDAGRTLTATSRFKPLVARPVDLSHPARADRREDLVGTELRSGGEAQFNPSTRYRFERFRK